MTSDLRPLPRPASPRTAVRRLACLILLALGAGCGSTGDPLAEATPYEPPGEGEEAPIGYYLSRLDASLRAWSNLKLDTSSEKDGVLLRGLEKDLNYRVTRRQVDILDQLETGPPKNRAVAAVALGFSDDPAVLSPLLAAVDDPDPEVANNALMGIGILGHAETPLTQITWILTSHPDPWVRVNAAYAIQRVIAAGGRSDVVPAACRRALADTEPGVRAQVAAILGLLLDADSVQDLGDLLFDSENLVASAAATSLARIGRRTSELRGDVARRLVDAFERRDGPVRSLVHRELARLYDGDLGQDVEPWREWAYRLP